MVHDITHCDNERCALNTTCYRYQAHLEAVRNKMSFISYYEDTTPIDGDCDRYIKYEKQTYND